MNYLFVFITVIGTVVGQIILKYGQHTLYFPKKFSFIELINVVIKNITNIYFIGSLFFALLAAFSWTLVIQRMKLSVAYPFMALGYVLIFIASFLLFKEHINIYQIIGMGLVVIGLIFISQS